MKESFEVCQKVDSPLDVGRGVQDKNLEVWSNDKKTLRKPEEVIQDKGLTEDLVSGCDHPLTFQQVGNPCKSIVVQEMLGHTTSFKRAWSCGSIPQRVLGHA